MSYPIPQIIYDGTILAFTYPPTGKPGPHDGNSDSRSAQRSDSYTLSGRGQKIWWRTDIFRTLQVEVPVDDLANWTAFIEYAEQGGQFDYYPDATFGDFDTWTLEDTDFNPARVVRGLAKVQIKLRKFVEAT